MSSFIVGAAQYEVGRLRNWDEYAAKLEQWVLRAVHAGAQVAMFPEYGAMELASLNPGTMGDLQGSIEFVSSLLPAVDGLHTELARRHGIYILAASAPWQALDGSFRNRARLFAPNGKVGLQDKLTMTRFEREQWGISAGDELCVFQTEFGKIGVCICYDVEFPLIARSLIEAGAEVILNPSCTDTLQGFHRVWIGARARALEGQCFTVLSPLVGTAPWSPAIDINRGRAGVFGPPDHGFPDNGIIAEGQADVGDWVTAKIDTTLVARVRECGSVLNFRDWGEQELRRANRLPVHIEDLDKPAVAEFRETMVPLLERFDGCPRTWLSV